MSSLHLINPITYKLYLHRLGLFAGLEHVQEVVVQQLEVAHVDPGVGMSRLELGARHGSAETNFQR